MLILQRKKNESITIGDDIRVTIVDISSDRVKIAIEAPKSVSIARTELLEAVNTNKEAASSDASSQALSDFARKLSGHE